MKTRFIRNVLGIVAVTALFSCGSTKKLTYFSDINEVTFTGIPRPDSIFIAPNDILSINISSENPDASAIFNPEKGVTSRTTTATGTSTEVGGYLVNEQGYINLPILGAIKAGGLTKEQLADAITRQLTDRKFLKSPLVEIRLLNYEVTVLGEVGHPTVITVPNERISMLKAIGLAGDLTIYGKRNNILLIRDEQGTRTTRKIDLTSPDFLKSPYYYLEPNDIVYVQPNRARGAQSTLWPQLAPIILTSLSVAIILLDRFFR